jgi:hypothetical protein
MHWHAGDNRIYTLLLQDGWQALGPLPRLAFRFQTPPQCQPKRQQRLHSVRSARVIRNKPACRHRVPITNRALLQS